MGGQNVKNTIIDTLLEFIAPHLCFGCGKTGSPLCDNCKKDIIKNSFTQCILCLRPSTSGVCRFHGLPYRGAWVVGFRKGPIRALIDSFKFQNMKAASRSLAELLHDRLPDLDPTTRIIPVPTAPGHIRERGYDHALLLARSLAKLRGLTLEKNLLARRDTATQHTAKRRERITQAENAFTLDGIVKAVPYLIVDDIFTTGATLQRVARLLHGAGARDVSVAVVARQPLD